MVTADVSETEALRARLEALTAQVESLENDAQTERVRFLAVERGSGADLAGKPESEIVAKLENDNREMYHELQTTKAKDHALHLKVRALEEELASERAKAAEAAKSHAGALESVTPRVTSSGRPTKQAFATLSKSSTRTLGRRRRRRRGDGRRARVAPSRRCRGTRPRCSSAAPS